MEESETVLHFMNFIFLGMRFQNGYPSVLGVLELIEREGEGKALASTCIKVKVKLSEVRCIKL